MSKNGFGKRTPLADFPMRGRGAQGVIAMQTSERNGQLVSAVQVFSGDELMLISNTGTLVRTDSDGVSVVGRNTQGVRLINLKEDEVLNSVERIAEQTLEQVGDEGSAATDDSQVDSDTSADADD